MARANVSKRRVSGGGRAAAAAAADVVHARAREWMRLRASSRQLTGSGHRGQHVLWGMAALCSAVSCADGRCDQAEWQIHHAPQ